MCFYVVHNISIQKYSTQLMDLQKSYNIMGDIVQKPASWIGLTVDHGLAVLLGFIVVVLVVYYLYKWYRGETFMPTALMRMQQNDNMLVMSKEHLDSGRDTSFFAKAVQNAAGGQFTVDSASAPGQPGSLAYQVLHSPDFNCAGRTAAPDNAWDWMTAVSTEGMAGTKNDNQLSALLAGH